MEQVEEAWAKARQDNPGLFNGRLFCSTSWTWSRTGQWSREGSWTTSATWPRGWSPGLPALRPVGVSGMILLHAEDGPMTVLGRRHPSMTTHARKLELVPSGGLDDSYPPAGDVLDHQAMLLRELEEETGVPADNVARVSDFLLVLDHGADTLDICMQLEFDGPGDGSLFPGSSSEYTALEVLAVEDAARRLEGEQGVPASCAMLDEFTNATRGSHGS